MAWTGYFTYDGREIINTTRTETYAKNANLTWFKPVFENDALPFMLGHGLRYTTPLFDSAPWVDPDIPESHDFYGLYPLDVTGLEDSSRNSSVVESLLDGGIPGRIRHATKALVFNGVLVARTDLAADYGMRWLRKVLLGGPCEVQSLNSRVICAGAELEYLSGSPDMEVPDDTAPRQRAVLDGGYFLTTHQVQVDEPDLDGGPVLSLSDAQFEGGTPFRTGGIVESGGVYPFVDPVSEVVVDLDPGDCLDPYRRSLRRVAFNSGPTLTGKRETSNGGAVWTVTFSGVAGNPWEYGAEIEIMRGFLDDAVAIPWAGGVEPEGGIMDADGYIHEEQPCGVAEYQPIYDPLCPAVIPPPGPPSVPLGCYTAPTNWQRRHFTIPKQFVPMWSEVVPKIAVFAKESDVRSLRLRFYPAPPQGEAISDETCEFMGDIVVSYIPHDHTLVLDGAERTVYVISPTGVRQRADSLVFNTQGLPFDWPALSCGGAHVVTVDLPQTEVPPVIDLSLYPRAV